MAELVDAAAKLEVADDPVEAADDEECKKKKKKKPKKKKAAAASEDAAPADGACALCCERSMVICLSRP